MKYKLIMDKKGKMYALVRANAYGRDHTRMPSFPFFKRCMFERIGSGYQLYGDSFMASLYWRSGLLHLDIIDILLVYGFASYLGAGSISVFLSGV